MGYLEKSDESIDSRIATRLRTLRAARGWSLGDLARRSGVSRATLSRLENAEVSATAQVLGKLCAAFGVTLSWLMHAVEDDTPPLIRRERQPEWSDPEIGFHRRAVSPPSPALAAEVVECTLAPKTRIDYETPPRPGAEHHLLMLSGRLRVELDGTPHDLAAGDCLRYRLNGTSAFETRTRAGARYILVTA